MPTKSMFLLKIVYNYKISDRENLLIMDTIHYDYNNVEQT